MSVIALQSACLALSIVLGCAFAAATENENGQAGSEKREIAIERAGGNKTAHLTPDHTIRDVLNHPAFSGFARLLLPWDGRAYDEDLRFNNISSLLPYHSHVSPTIVAGSLNRMIDDVSRGKAIFHDFYSKAQKQQDPAREHAGLFSSTGSPERPLP
jgi:hypothetical protein